MKHLRAAQLRLGDFARRWWSRVEPEAPPVAEHGYDEQCEQDEVLGEGKSTKSSAGIRCSVLSWERIPKMSADSFDRYAEALGLEPPYRPKHLLRVIEHVLGIAVPISVITQSGRSMTRTAPTEWAKPLSLMPLAVVEAWVPGKGDADDAAAAIDLAREIEEEGGFPLPATFVAKRLGYEHYRCGKGTWRDIKAHGYSIEKGFPRQPDSQRLALARYGFYCRLCFVREDVGEQIASVLKPFPDKVIAEVQELKRKRAEAALVAEPVMPTRDAVIPAPLGPTKGDEFPSVDWTRIESGMMDEAIALAAGAQSGLRAPITARKRSTTDERERSR